MKTIMKILNEYWGLIWLISIAIIVVFSLPSEELQLRKKKLRLEIECKKLEIQILKQGINIDYEE